MDIKYIIEIFPQIAAYIPVTLLMAINCHGISSHSWWLFNLFI
ncbi:hypothetical protein JCM5176_09490 [Streptococcus sobrinus]|nr:Uncharacterised protein [Streptococcus sobrinus]SQG19303.1 Uncharacterised protein [Streptococcus sobrinus]